MKVEILTGDFSEQYLDIKRDYGRKLNRRFRLFSKPACDLSGHYHYLIGFARQMKRIEEMQRKLNEKI